MKLAIVDIGLGKLHSVEQAFLRAGAAAQICADPQAIASAERVVFPGQGAYAECAQVLQGAMGEALNEFIATGRPYLGICLGMQALFSSSEESEGSAGLGLFEGQVIGIPQGLHHEDGTALKVPHMGWNQVQTSHSLLDDAAWYYFVHSYHCRPVDSALIVGKAAYGVEICAAVAKDNVFACQFHPEKSQAAGARVIERFLTWEGE